MTDSSQLETQFNNLVDWMRKHPQVVVAYSGGVDSTLVAFAAYRAHGDKARIVFCQTPLIAHEEVNDAVKLATQLNFPLRILELNPLELDMVRTNEPDRCYFCKHHIFSTIATEHSDYVVVDGTNLDDTFTDRPGLRALTQLHVESPLAELKITKTEIRAISKMLGLPNWDKPSAPCLATRFKSHTTMSLEMLERVQEAERIVRDAGFSYVRVRDNYPQAIIEVHPREVERLQHTLESVRGSLTHLYQVLSVAPLGYPGSTD